MNKGKISFGKIKLNLNKNNDESKESTSDQSEGT